MNISLMVACNLHRNGSFAGRANQFLFEYPDGRELTLESPYVDAEIKFDWRIARGLNKQNAFTIGRSTSRPYKCGPIKNWVGNWCWDQTNIDEKTATSVCKRLKRFGYIPTSGTQEMWNWFIDELNTKAKG